jgi:hypothetical protein
MRQVRSVRAGGTKESFLGFQNAVRSQHDHVRERELMRQEDELVVGLSFDDVDGRAIMRKLQDQSHRARTVFCG